MLNAIAESNGWDDRTAALQLFAHLQEEALNVALLLPEEGLSKALSEYYNSPGRLAIFRRKFDNVSHRAGEDIRPLLRQNYRDSCSLGFRRGQPDSPDPNGPRSVHPGTTRLNYVVIWIVYHRTRRMGRL